MNIPKEFNNLVHFATRPLTLQGDESRRVMWYHAKMRYLSIPGKGTNRSVYSIEEEMRDCYKKLVKKIKGNYPKYLLDYKKITDSMYEASRKVGTSLKLPNFEKANLLKKWNVELAKFYLLAISPWALEYFLDGECRKMLEENFPQKKEEYFEIISSPTKINDYQKMRLTICKLALNGKVEKKEIGKLVENYFWYSEYTFIEPLLDEAYFIREIKKLNKQEAKKEIGKTLAEIKENKKRFISLQRKIKDKKLKLLAKILNDHTYIRTERMDYLKKSLVRIRPFYEWLALELSKKTKRKWTSLQINYLLNEEIILFLEKKIIPDQKKVIKRSNNQYVYYYDGRPNVITNQKFIDKLKKIIDNQELANKEIKGTISFRGLARGRVSIVENKLDLKKVKKGDILVAKTTMPEYTPVMRIAGAFVTDEGGVTSHAAIISRELKKPCIVGTKIATKVLHDGDFIEVDANQGIVKIINKK